MRLVLTVISMLATASAGRAITPEETEFFETKIRPVLAEQCYKCHGAEKQKADLRVDSRAGILKGSDNGPVIVAGRPEESSFIKSIRHEGDSKMPEKADKLPDPEIAALAEWVKMGMPWPESDKPASSGFSAKDTKSHWSWQPLRDPTVPEISNQQPAASTPIDAFIGAKLEQSGLAMSPPASKRTLLRRATFDLTGLPPTFEEFAAFENDASPDAWRKVIDRLLASSRYGERWGRYWLDVARYADTRGYLAGGEERRYPFSHTYRDWVIRAFNDDLPYDQFIIQQIAGDHVVKDGDNTPMAALGFLTLGRRFLNNQHDIIDDRIDVVSRGLMGLTVACARCHDHKFDPIPTRDYYALYGVFASTVEPPSRDLPLLPVQRDPAADAEYQRQLAGHEAKIEEFFAEKRDVLAWRTLLAFGVPAALPEDRSDARRNWLDREGREALTRLHNKIEELNAGPVAPPRAMALLDKPQPVTPRVLVRGNPGRAGDEVPRRFLTVLSGGDPQPFDRKSSGRLDLARAIASKDNPLTARVMVNRVWNLHFGKGLVRTPGDFGVKGEPPTHPELLDWLASRFIADGWSLKKLHRTIMLSAAYQQSSDERPDLAQSDPENRLVWRMNRRRLDFEAMRDSLLACAGQLDPTMGGRGVELATEPFATRRAVYGFIDRQNLPGVFRTFDFASPDSSSPQRFVTMVPQQALFMMNSPFVAERARGLVAAPEFKADAAEEARIQALYQRVLGRRAEPAEAAAGLHFIRNATERPESESREADAPPIWRYGFGSYDAEARRVKFEPLAHFQKGKWQGGEKMPDPKLGHLSLSADGGHPGVDGAHGAIRRWTAAADAVVTINGAIERPAEAGDGVAGSIISSRLGELLKVEVAPKQRAELKLERVEVKAGDTLDFLVDCRNGNNSDSFTWRPVIAAGGMKWDAAEQFAGPPPPRPIPLKPWEQYAQVLLQTNEFVFVD